MRIAPVLAVMAVIMIGVGALLPAATAATAGGGFVRGPFAPFFCPLVGNTAAGWGPRGRAGRALSKGRLCRSPPRNPLLGALQDNGGPTPTMALLTGSPAVDAGDDTLTDPDQRGFPRPSGSHVDIGAFEGVALAAETLLVGNGINNTISRIEIRSGASLGTFVLSGAGSHYQLVGPRCLLCISNLLLVVNQNVDTPYNGEILKFDLDTGAFLANLFPSSHPNAPYVPRGMLAGPDGTIYVADLGNFDGVYLGHVARFNL